MSASYLRKYGAGTGADIYINIPKAGSANHAVSGDWTPAAGDVKISKDGAAAANIGTLPTAIAMGNSTIWKFVFADAELQAAFIAVTISDSATKAVDDTGFSIETYGNASAQHAFDLDTASTAQTGDSFARLGAPAGASVSADIAAIEGQTDDIGVAGAGLTAVPWNASWDAEVQSEVQDALAAAQTESYATDGSTASMVQLLYMIWAFLAEKSVAGTTLTAAKLDGSTSAMTFTLDSDTAPTSITRAS